MLLQRKKKQAMSLQIGKKATTAVADALAFSGCYFARHQMGFVNL